MVRTDHPFWLGALIISDYPGTPPPSRTSNNVQSAKVGFQSYGHTAGGRS